MNEFQIVRDIECPVGDVFAALINFDKVPDWNPGVVEIRWMKDEPVQVGSTMVWVGKFLGKVSESDSQITEFEPAHSGEFGQSVRSFRTPRRAVGGREATDVCVSR